MSDLRVLEGENFGQYGKKRDQFARAMLERAVNAVDTSGSLRKASGQCVAALLMLEFLLTCSFVFFPLSLILTLLIRGRSVSK